MSEIHSIVEHRDLEIHFMPIVRFWGDGDSSRWSPFAFEALIRGPRESRLRRPDALFAAAAAAGLTERLELMCLEAAFEKIPAIPEQALLFLNIGVDTFLGSGFEQVLAHWADQLHPERLVFEIVEGAVPSVSRFRKRMELGRAAGFRYALDDLPAGEEALRRIDEAGPVAFFKIDRSFVSRWSEDRDETRRWLAAVAESARNTGAEVVIEGVESPLLHSLPEISALGVGLAQGFMFGEPAILGPGFQTWRRGFRRYDTPLESLEQAPLSVVTGSSATRMRERMPALTGARRRPTLR